MPFFNFRRGGQSSANAAPASQPESVEVIRKRARHRLIGAAVLVLAGVVGFPLLFDTQPRPVAIDIPIEIPGKNTVKPLALPSRDAASAPAAAVAAVTPAPATPATPTPAASAPRVAPASSLAAREEIVPDKPATPPVAAVVPPKPAASVAKPAVVAAVKPEPKPETPKPAAVAKPSATDDAARARALLEGKPAAAAAAPTAADEGRMIVQVGAFSDVTKAREARMKLERAGLKTYTQVTETKDGRRIRVRVGPFATRAEAEKAASKIKGLDLPAAILTL